MAQAPEQTHFQRKWTNFCNILFSEVAPSHRDLCSKQTAHIRHLCMQMINMQSSWSKGISETNLKLQIPCSKCMHWSVMSQADAFTSQAYACMYCMHCPMMSQADACSYCIGSVVLILSRIYPQTPKNIDCLSHLVCFISTVTGRSNKKRKEKKNLTFWKAGASSRHITNLKQSILETFDIYGSTFISSYFVNMHVETIDI